jgi:hypothetical protein
VRRGAGGTLSDYVRCAGGVRRPQTSDGPSPKNSELRFAEQRAFSSNSATFAQEQRGFTAHGPDQPVGLDRSGKAHLPPSGAAEAPNARAAGDSLQLDAAFWMVTATNPSA